MSSILKSILKKILKPFGLLRLSRAYKRRKFALNYYNTKLKLINRWSLKDTEDSNFYYHLTDHNFDVLAHIISIVTKKKYEDIKKYFVELESDNDLREFIKRETLLKNYGKDINIQYGRRFGWYAIARATYPKIIVETGVSHGIGALVLTKALILNKKEGHAGRYYGTEIDTSMGKLLSGKYKDEGEILYGDSTTTLKKFKNQIDLFINDSDHSAEYEYQEYKTVENKLSEYSIILGDNSHSTDKLSTFSKEKKRKFLFFKEQPLNHWYPGAGIGISFR